MAVIEAIVFDIGRVLVDFSLDGFAQFLHSKGSDVRDKPQFIAASGMRNYELGAIDTDTFLQQVATLVTEHVEPEEIARQWQAIFQPIPEMIQILERYSKTHRTFLLSNTNELHWEYLDREYQLGSYVEATITSFETGSLKPSPEIFQAAQEAHGLLPNSTLFIDDIREHIDTVESLGWHGIHHQSVEQTRKQLAEILE